jgi:hypothetical protein
MFMKDLIVFNGNDGQAPQAKLFIETLRDPSKGAFDGDIAIISTALSPEYVAWYESQGVLVFQRRVVEVLDEWKHWLDIAIFEHVRVNKRVRYYRPWEFLISKYTKGDLARRYALLQKVFKFCAKISPQWRKKLHDEFEIWHRKHMSKLNIIPFLESHGKRWDRVMLCDADMVFQGQAKCLFERVEPGKICVAEELEAMVPMGEGGSPVYGSNVITREQYPEWRDLIELGPDARHEVNVGVFLGDYDTVLQTALDWRALMLESGYEWLFYCHIDDFLHEQDFFRLLRDRDKNKFVDLGLDLIYHGCNAARLDISFEEDRFTRKSNGVVPVLMHFAGGIWKDFPVVEKPYSTSSSQVILD